MAKTFIGIKQGTDRTFIIYIWSNEGGAYSISMNAFLTFFNTRNRKNFLILLRNNTGVRCKLANLCVD